MGLFSSSEFDELSILVGKATSEYIPAAQEDLALNLEITDIIKSKRVSPKDSLRLLLTRLTHDNPNVQLLSLQLLDKCVKNGGKHFLVEMAGREFVDVVVSLMDDNEYGHECNHLVQERLIELFQEWALIFQSDPSLTYLYDTYNALKIQKRVYFPVPAKSLDQVDPLSIFSSLAPPEWTDSPVCQRCRDTFTLTNRKHHCRKCGGTFCQLCSSNETVLLEMGITEPVRVCDSCYKIPVKDEKRREIIYEQKAQQPQSRQQTLEEDKDLKKAIELSLKDQNNAVTFIENPEKAIDDDALKKAIEASLKEVGPNHMSASAIVPNVKLEYFNAVELENISMFHQLIGRLIRTRPPLSPEDATDLKKLASEMRKLQKRPMENETVKTQLNESIKGFELLFEPASKAPSPPLSWTNKSDSSKDLNQMKSEMFGDNTMATAATLGTVRTRLGSMSLENVNEQLNCQQVSQSSSQSGGIVSHPVSRPIATHNHPHNTMISPPSLPQAFINQVPVQIPHILQSSQTPVPLLHPPHNQSQVTMHGTPPTFSAPIQMCPEMTIHPHPIHPFSHENPYAVKKEPEMKNEKKKKKSKSKKKEEDKKEKKKRKDKDKKEKRSSKEPIEATSDKQDKLVKQDKSESNHESKSGNKHMKKKSKKEVFVDSQKSDKSHDEIVLKPEVESGRKSPINLIDL